MYSSYLNETAGLILGSPFIVSAFEEKKFSFTSFIVGWKIRICLLRVILGDLLDLFKICI